MPPVLFTLADSGSTSLLSLPPHILIIAGVGFLFFVLSAVLVALSSAVGIWVNLRPRPPTHEVYATKDELTHLERRITTTIHENRTDADVQLGVLFEKFDAMTKGWQAFTNDVFRAIGKLEGQAARAPHED